MSLYRQFLIPFISFSVSLLFSPGCKTQKSYRGPTPEPSQTSHIIFHAENISISNVRLDQERLGLLTKAIETNPGSHRAQVDFTLNDTECHYYLSGCVDVSYQGSCEVSFSSKRGESYVVDIEGIGKSVFISVKAHDPLDPETSEAAPRTVAVGICRVTHRKASGKELPPPMHREPKGEHNRSTRGT